MSFMEICLRAVVKIRPVFSTFHEFPNFQVDVYALVLENDGSALPAAITCAGLALADASVPMYDLVTATALGVHGDLKFIDPSSEEAALCNSAPRGGSKNHGIITVAYSPTHQQISEFAEYGMMDIECVTGAIQLLTKTCEDINPLTQQCLVRSVVRTLQKKKKNQAKSDLSSDKVAC